MLFVFYMDTGTMLNFDVGVAMQSVAHLQQEIFERCQIPVDKQVLLVSGGDHLDPKQRVASYTGAGMDSNPIFLFSKQSIEIATPPTASITSGSVSSLKEKVEGSLHLPDTYDSLVSRVQLALEFAEVAKSLYRTCEDLVHDQHLLHQGWAAVVANLDDITSAFRTRSDVFVKSLEEYLGSRDGYLSVVRTFPQVIDLLAKIPLLSGLVAERSLRHSGSVRMQSESGSVRMQSSCVTLLDWISAQDTRNTLEQMMQQCVSGMEQFDEALLGEVGAERGAMLQTIDNEKMKEVKGLELRLSQLEQLMIDAKKHVSDLSEMSQGFVQNQARARNLQDMSILPDLCASHRAQLQNMLGSHDALVDIRRRCNGAKEELSANLHSRLRWVMFVEKSVCEIDNKLTIRHETLKRIRHRVEILAQIHSAPDVYCLAVVEVLRRRNFTAWFTQMSGSVSETCSREHQRELELRGKFDTTTQRHFLRNLFPGFEDTPSSFAAKLPKVFDERLPPVTTEDVAYLKNEVPELADKLRIPDDAFPALVFNASHARSRSPPTDGAADPSLLSAAAVQSKRPSGSTLELSTQSVEIITQEESLLVQQEVPSSSAQPEGGRGVKGAPVGAVVGRGGIVETSPEGAEGHGGDGAFMTADFYIDESMPSSITDMSSSKKLTELQALLQEKAAILESKEKELSDSCRVSDQLRSQLSSAESTSFQLYALLHRDLPQLKSVVDSLKVSVGVENATFSADFVNLSREVVFAVQRFGGTTDELVAAERSRLAERDAELADCDAQIVALNERLGFESAAVHAAVRQTEETEALHEGKCAELARVTSELEQATCHVAELDRMKVELAELEKACAEKESALVEAKARESGLEAEHAEISVKLEEAQKNVTERDERLKKLAEDLIATAAGLSADSRAALDECLIYQEALRREASDKHVKDMENLNLTCSRLSEELAEALRAAEEGNKLHAVALRATEESHAAARQELEGSHAASLLAIQASHAVEMERLKNEFFAGLNGSSNCGDDLRLSSKAADLQSNETPLSVAPADRPNADSPETLRASEVVPGEFAHDDEGLDEELFKTGFDNFVGTAGCGAEEGEFKAGLVVDDLIPAQRHEAIVAELKANLEEERATSILAATEDLRYRYESQIADLTSQLHQLTSLQQQTKDSDQVTTLEEKPIGPGEEIKRSGAEVKRSGDEELLSSLDAERQIKFNEALNRAVAERDRVIERLEHRQTTLLHDVQQLKGQLHEALHGSNRPYVDPNSALDAVTHPSQISPGRAMSRSTLVPSTDRPDLQRGTMSQSTISQSGAGGHSFMVVGDDVRNQEQIGQLEKALKQKSDENASLQNKLAELSMSKSTCAAAATKGPTISIVSCSEGEVLLFTYSETHGHYLAFLPSESILHFIHSDSLQSLDLLEGTKNPAKLKHWIVAEVVNKEYCLAKKKVNRFKLPMETKFYRVRAKPWAPSAIPDLPSSKPATPSKATLQSDPQSRQLSERKKTPIDTPEGGDPRPAFDQSEELRPLSDQSDASHS